MKQIQKDELAYQLKNKVKEPSIAKIMIAIPLYCLL